MRPVLLNVWIALLAPFARAEESKPSVPAMKEKLHGIIRQQMEAFRRKDYAAAYVFAATGIKKQFPVETFEKMVKAGYPMIAESKESIFGLTLDDGERAVVTVRVIGAEKQSASYQYLLEREGETWRIAGVYEVEEKSETI